MQRPATRADYGSRLEKVVAYIGSHLQDDLDLNRLAELAHFSPYHFHRIYRQLMGETPKQTLRRLRLHHAAVAVIQSDEALAAIAARAGYGSLEAFSRAFAASYGKAPSEFRSLRRGAGGLPPVAAPAAQTQANKEAAMFDLTIRRNDPIRLFGIPHKGAYHAIGTSFDRLFTLAASNGLITPDAQGIGVYYDDPNTVPEAELQSFAGVSVDAQAVLIEGLEERHIPAAESAVLVHKGPYADLEAAYAFLYRDWLANSGREPAEIPVYEIYLNDPKTLPPTEWLTEVVLPLKDLSASLSS